MLSKILFTALVILAVYIFYRYRGRVRISARKVEQPRESHRFGRLAVYAIVAVLLLVSGAIYFYQWQLAHRIITIRVIDSATNNVTIYQAYHKAIKGNRFQSLDGKTVVLSEAERVEFIEKE